MTRIVFAAAFVAGCANGYSYKLTPSMSGALTAKTATCDFRVVNIPPQSGFEEIATLTPEGFGAQSPDDFKEAIRADVCRAGGDVVVGEVNGRGQYVRGTVLRGTQEPAQGRR